MGYILRKNPDDPNMKLAVIDTTSPLAICGVYPSATPYAGNELAFDMSSFRGHAFLLSVDGSVKDLEKNLKKDSNNSEKGIYVDKQKKPTSIFPEDDNGNDTAPNYIVLTPDL